MVGIMESMEQQLTIEKHSNAINDCLEKLESLKNYPITDEIAYKTCQKLNNSFAKSLTSLPKERLSKKQWYYIHKLAYEELSNKTIKSFTFKCQYNTSELKPYLKTSGYEIRGGTDIQKSPRGYEISSDNFKTYKYFPTTLSIAKWLTGNDVSLIPELGKKQTIKNPEFENIVFPFIQPD